EPRRQLERLQRVLARVNVPIDVGARQRENDRLLRMRLTETLDRCMTPSSVQRQQQIILVISLPLGRYSDLVSRGAQHRGPAQRGVPVSGARSGPGGR